MMRHSATAQRRSGGWPVRGLLTLLTTIGVALAVAVLPAAALAASPPSEVQTEPAEVIPGGAKLKGELNPGGLPTTYYFVYARDTCDEGCTPSRTATGGPLTGDTQQEVPAVEVTGLSGSGGSERYWYYLVASNADGTVFGGLVNFTPGALPPTIESESVSNVTEHDATLEAEIRPESGAELTYFVEYGATTSYGASAPTPPATISWVSCGLECEPEETPRYVSVNLTGLEAGTTYHYRFIATNRRGEAKGEDATFTTPPARTAPTAPVIESVSLSQLTSTDATLEARIDTEGLSTIYQFELRINLCPYSECIGYKGIPLPSGLLLGSFADQAVSLDLNSVGVSLAPGVYEYALSATSTGGHIESPWQTLIPAVLNPPAPSVSTQSGTGPPVASGGSGQPAGSAGADQPAASGPSSSSSTPGVVCQPTTWPPGCQNKALPKPPKPLTSAQKLAKALNLCERKPKNQRPSCKRQAEKKYSAPSKHHA